jgi:hypothetical protein
VISEQAKHHGSVNPSPPGRERELVAPPNQNVKPGVPLPDKIAAALARFREAIPANFDSAYVENAVIPFFLTSFYEGERPLLPMIDPNLSKDNGLPFDLWGLLYKDWKPIPKEGVAVFLQGLEKRGDNRPAQTNLLLQICTVRCMAIRLLLSLMAGTRRARSVHHLLLCVDSPHMCARHLLQRGVDIVMITLCSGHESMQTT